MKPSIESSTSGSGLPLPLPQASPIRAVSRLLQSVSGYSSGSASWTSFQSSGRNTPDKIDSPVLSEETSEALSMLKKSSSGFLLSDQPLPSTSKVSQFHIPLVLPPAPSTSHLTSALPQSELEHQLQNALHQSQERAAYQEGVIRGLQSSMILNELYTECLRQEKGKAKEKTTNARLLGDGLPVVLSGDEFYEKARRHSQKQKFEEERKKQHQTDQAAYLQALKKWKEEDAARKEANNKTRTMYQLEIESWNRRKAEAKAAGVKFTEKKPVQGQIINQTARPKAPKSQKKEVSDLDPALDDLEFIDLGSDGEE